MTKVSTILLVEDELSITDMYKAQFQASGLKLEIAKNMEEGWQKVEDLKPDLILLDLILPAKDGSLDPHLRVGFSLLKKIKAHPEYKKIPVVVLSNLDTTKDRTEAHKLGAIDYAIKAQLLPKEVLDVAKKYLNFKEEK